MIAQQIFISLLGHTSMIETFNYKLNQLLITKIQNNEKYNEIKKFGLIITFRSNINECVGNNAADKRLCAQRNS